MHRQGSDSHGSSRRESLGQHHADDQHKDESVPSVCAEYSTIWKRSMDPLLPSNTQARFLSHALPQTTIGHHLVKSRYQQGRLGPGRDMTSLPC